MIAKFEYDSHKGIVKINGSEPIVSITDINIERKEGERYATVSLKLEADVVVEGKLLIFPESEARKLLDKQER